MHLNPRINVILFPDRSTRPVFDWNPTFNWFLELVDSSCHSRSPHLPLSKKG